jgi:hypothetical protein
VRQLKKATFSSGETLITGVTIDVYHVDCSALVEAAVAIVVDGHDH